MRKLKKKIALMMCTVITMFSVVTVRADHPYAGSDLYGGSWTESSFFGLKKTTYYYDAEYYKKEVVMLNNLSGTVKWDGKKKGAEKLEIGIFKTTTVSESKAITVSGNIGLSLPVKASDVSGKIGGSYTKGKTYTVANGKSITWTLNKDSKSGYYAVTHSVNCDFYKVEVAKNKSNNVIGKGKLIRYATKDGYIKLTYKSTSF